MSQIRLYVDEDAAEHAVVEGLRSRGVDVLTVLEAEMTRAKDAEQLEYATAEGRAIYTLNVDDFCRLHHEFLSTGREHAGIIVIPRQRYSIGEKTRRLLALVATVTAEQLRNRVEYV